MSVVDDVKARLDIVDVVSGYVVLQKSGRYLKAPCPFHSEKTPSFIVNSDRQSWHCFGACGTGGDLLSFVMRMENLDFGSALRLLAQRAGVPLTESREGGGRHDALYSINQAAVRFYQDVLESDRGREAGRYLEKRGVDQSARSRFQLGFSPGGRGSLKENLLALGFALDDAVEAGLIYREKDGGTRDFFRGRLMFPIHDRRGRVAGFGARSMDGSEPKYLNIARTPIFDKKAILYGLHLAAESIRKRNTAIVVEGYMDVIAAHQHGYAHVVASMGTALTEEQVSQLKSMATNYVLALDPDAAGQAATLRSLQASWRALELQAVAGGRRGVGTLYRREQLSLKIAALPVGRDPDQVIRADSAQWERLIDDALPWLDYFIPAVASGYDLTSGQGKAQAAEAIFPLIASVGNPFDQEQYFEKLSEVLGVTVAALKASVGRTRSDRPVRNLRRATREPEPQATVSPLSGFGEDSLEEYTLALLLSRPDLKEQVEAFAPEIFRKSEAREVFTRWLRCSTIEQLENSLDESLRDHLSHLTQKQLAPADRRSGEAALAQCLQRLEERHLQGLQQGLLASEDSGVPPSRELEETVAAVNARLRQLFADRVGSTYQEP